MFQGFLKQSTQVTVLITVISTSDHIAGKTGLSGGLTIYATKAGAAAAAITPTVAEIDSTNMPGVYSLVLTTTHTNTLGEFAIHVTGSGADPLDLKWQVTARLLDDLAYPATTGRSMVVDASGLVDANMVKMGPTGSGTAQTARDIGTSVLLSSGTGTGQLKLASGYVAMTWADIAAPTTTVGLSGTTVGTVTTATNVTTVNGLASGVITATSIAADAITAAKIADGAIDAATFAAGAIDATAIAANAIGASELATDAVTEIVTAILTTQMTESYPALHTAPTLAQSQFEIRSLLAEKSVSSTTLTTKKIDGSTSAETFTLDSSSSPTSITRAS